MSHFQSVLLLSLTALLARPVAAEEPPIKLPTVEVRDFAPLRKKASIELKQERYGAAVVTAGDYLYVIGGSNEQGTRLDTIERIDVRTGQSTPWARLRLARRHHRAVVLGSSIYVLGGTSYIGKDSDLISELTEYNEDDNVTFASARTHNTSGAVQYTTGSSLKWYGGGGSAPSLGGEPSVIAYENSMEVIDLATGQSHFGPPMPVGKALFGCVALDHKIYVFGGQRRHGDQVFTTNTTEVFDPVAGQWSPGVNMPTPRRCTAVVVDYFAVILGGRNGTQRVNTIEVFNPFEKVWRRLPDLAERCNPSTVVWAGSHLFLFGDQTASRRQLTYDLRVKQLVPYPMPFPDGDFATAVARDGKIYVVGGANLFSGTVNPHVQVFDVAPEPVRGVSVEK